MLTPVSLPPTLISDDSVRPAYALWRRRRPLTMKVFYSITRPKNFSVTSLRSVLNLFPAFSSHRPGPNGSYRDLSGPEKCKNRVISVFIGALHALPVRPLFCGILSRPLPLIRGWSLAPGCTYLQQLAPTCTKKYFKNRSLFSLRVRALMHLLTCGVKLADNVRA